jgi:hypothetical protein
MEEAASGRAPTTNIWVCLASWEQKDGSEWVFVNANAIYLIHVQSRDGNGYPKPEYPTGITR